MWKFTFLFLCFPTVKNVVGLLCYRTDINKHEGNLKYEVQDCIKILGFTAADAKLLPPEAMKCYTLLHSGTEIKGCTITGNCKMIRRTFRRFSYRQKFEAECYECGEDRCNSPQGPTVQTPKAKIIQNRKSKA